MLISHPDQLREGVDEFPTRPWVYVHVPKTGGDSLTRALEPYASPGEWQGVGQFKHLAARDIRKRWFISGRRWQGYFSFGFVRNPWDHVACRIHYTRMMGAIVAGEITPELAPWAKSFDKEKLKDPKVARWLERCKQVRSMPFDRVVEDICGTAHGGLLNAYLRDFQNHDIVSFIGRHENLADDFAEICQRIGLPLVPELPHVNQTVLSSGQLRGPYRDDYSAASKDLVAKAFAYDIERLGYEY